MSSLDVRREGDVFGLIPAGVKHSPHPAHCRHAPQHPLHPQPGGAAARPPCEFPHPLALQKHTRHICLLKQPLPCALSPRHAKICWCSALAVGMSRDRAVALSDAGKEGWMQGRRLQEGRHRSGTMTEMKSEQLRSCAGRQEGMAGEEQRFLAGAEFLLISGIVPLEFISPAGCSLLPGGGG